MLSYRHAFHAGNFADLLKHSVLLELIAYLQRKDKGFAYVDTHAGAGMYRLDSAMALKTGESAAGVLRWLAAGPVQAPMLKRLQQAVAAVNTAGSAAARRPADNAPLHFYPGSALLAVRALRAVDSADLYELHPSDSLALQAAIGDCHTPARVRVHHSCGFAGLAARLPVPTRRALVLIDPSYELKTDYTRVIEASAAALQRMANTVIAIWYPVLAQAARDNWVRQASRSLQRAGAARLDCYELGVSPVPEASAPAGPSAQGPASVGGMCRSGVLVVNAPWSLPEVAQPALTELGGALSQDGAVHVLSDRLFDTG
jgi:23S rRNA (adenine2030-N6)-methyltransferase